MMEQTTQTNTPDTVGNSAGASALGVGRMLREARERAGLSVADVANRLKFAPRQITALEEEDFAQLPEMTFLRGFVRSYARVLQLDEAPLLAALPSARSQEAPPQGKTSVDEPFPNIYAMRKPNIIWWAAALVVALVIGIFYLGHDARQAEPVVATVNTPLMEPASAANDTTTASAVPATEAKLDAVEEKIAVAPLGSAVVGANSNAASAVGATAVHKPAARNVRHAEPKAEAANIPHTEAASVAGTTPSAAEPVSEAKLDAGEEKVVAAPVVPASVTNASSAVVGAVDTHKPTGRSLLRLVFDEDSWVEVKDQNGTILLSLLGLRGSEHSVYRVPPFSIVIGHAQGVRLYFKGKQIDLEPYTKIDVAHLTLE